MFVTFYHHRTLVKKFQSQINLYCCHCYGKVVLVYFLWKALQAKSVLVSLEGHHSYNICKIF